MNTKVFIVWWPTKWICLSCNHKKALHGFVFAIALPRTLLSPSPPAFFYMGKLRKSNYYLTNLFKSKVSDYVSPRKIARCVFKFWMLQLNLAKVHCFLNASKTEHCAFDGCFWSLIKTLKGQRSKDWSKLHSLTIHTAQSKCRNQLQRSCVSSRKFV